MKQEDFTLTGPTARTEKPASLNAVGSSVGRGGAVASPVDTAKVRRFLSARTTKEVNEAAISRASQLGVALRVNYDFRSRQDEHGNTVSRSITVKGVDATGTPEAKAAAAEMIEALRTPATRSDIEAWLAELSVIVSRRQDDEFTESLRLTAYTDRLARYPADVAREALLVKAWKFWPAWSELEAVCEDLCTIRNAMRTALRREEPTKDADRTPVSADRAAEIMAEFGFAPKRMDQ